MTAQTVTVNTQDWQRLTKDWVIRPYLVSATTGRPITDVPTATLKQEKTQISTR